jgi:hypothetical protein
LFLVIWLSAIAAWGILQGNLVTADWGNTLTETSLVLSMAVNALVTSLIVLRIFKVFREVKGTMTSDEQALGATGGRKLRTIIFVLIESGMVLFSIQLVRLVLAFIVAINTAYSAYLVIIPIHQMIIVIITSVITISYFY